MRLHNLGTHQGFIRTVKTDSNTVKTQVLVFQPKIVYNQGKGVVCFVGVNGVAVVNFKPVGVVDKVLDVVRVGLFFLWGNNPGTSYYFLQ